MSVEMKYVYERPLFPHGSERLKIDLERAAARLAERIDGLDVNALPIGGFSRHYFASKRRWMQASLQRSTYLLAWCLAPLSANRFEELVIVDYGAGTGELSLLAKELGVGTVVHCDISENMTGDARSIAIALSLPADYYITSDVDGLIRFLTERGLLCDAVISNDAIEHIYDMNGFLMALTDLPSRRLVVTLATGANPRNPLISRRLMGLQRKMEFQGTIRTEDESFEDTAEAYLPLRRRMIEAQCGRLEESDIVRLAKRTRGMRRDDIEAAVNRYVATGGLPPFPSHLTNTCDPYTGNWCEQLVDPSVHAKQLRAAGFEVRIVSGYYGSGGSGGKLKRFARQAANVAITSFGMFGLKLAPFYCIHAVRASR